MSALAKSILGTDLPIEQTIRYGFSPSNGYTTTRTWRSANRALLDAKTAELTGWQWEITEGFGAHTLVATLSGLDDGSGGASAEIPITTWELLPNKIEKDFLESNSANNVGVTRLSADEIDDIKAAIDGNDRGLAPTTADAWEAYLLITKGFKSAVVFQPTLHKSQIVSANYNTAFSIANAGKIISTATLRGSEIIPALFTLPDDTSPADSYTGDLVNQPRLRYGWLKNYPTVTQVSNNKFQISQTWEYGLWARLIFGDPF